MSTSAVHPKTSGSALGGSLGILVVAILGSVHGVHLNAEANAAIPTFLATLGAFLSPSADGSAQATNPPNPPPDGSQGPVGGAVAP